MPKYFGGAKLPRYELQSKVARSVNVIPQQANLRFFGMNEKAKAIDINSNGCLILILPAAFLTIFLFTAWPAILATVLLGAGYKTWKGYEWQKWCQQVNPTFHKLIQENQGSVTAMDLAMKANFSGEIAKRYLDTKASEFGAQILDHTESNPVYYFVTSKTLGSIFDTSEPSQNNEPRVFASAISQQTLPKLAEVHTEVEVQPPPEVREELLKAVAGEPIKLDKQLIFGSLIQSELAKRLSVYSSTVYKRRNDPDFSEWSRSKDPEGIAWTYSPKTKEFFPLEEES